MNEKLKQQLDAFVKNIESRKQAEKIAVLVMLIVGLGLGYLTIVFDPVSADNERASSEINSVTRQIQAQQQSYAEMLATSQEDPNKFANDRLAVIARSQARLEDEIRGLAGDLVTPNEMTTILTSVLERQEGLDLIMFRNSRATPLREGISNAPELLQANGGVNLADTRQEDVSRQVYEHGLTIEFEGDFFSTLKYLRFLEEITGSFFWDSISFKQSSWPRAHVTLQIHTLSTDQGFIGV